MVGRVGRVGVGHQISANLCRSLRSLRLCGWSLHSRLFAFIRG